MECTHNCTTRPVHVLAVSLEQAVPLHSKLSNQASTPLSEVRLNCVLHVCQNLGVSID